jgi:histone deacetylase complex regulatory component SIN3
VQEWIKKEAKPAEKPPPPAPIQLEEIKDQALLPRLETHPHFRDIIKILQLYLKSVISIEELRALLHPVYASDPSLIYSITQTAEEVIQRRRRATIFAPLNELVDKKYPNLSQVGESYILIPEGYANYSRGWRSNPLEVIMNRKCVSVPLGSEVSFIINKKTDYEEQLFNYEDQRYEIDSALSSLRAAIALLRGAEEQPGRL